MSYPPGPDPYGQPNPYSQPQQPGPPPQYGQPYGYPQQPPPPYGPMAGPGGYPGYPGYPGQPGYPGWPGAYVAMPGVVVAARVILFIIAGLELLSGVLAMISSAVLSAQSGYRESSDAISYGIGVGVGILIVGGLTLTLAIRYSKGRGGVRGCTIALGILYLLSAVGNLIRGATPPVVVGVLVLLGLGILFLVAMFGRAGTAYFSRPRH